jgi:hypothetical protein
MESFMSVLLNFSRKLKLKLQQVSPEVIPIYKSLLKKATVITPNQFEAELFSDLQITSLASLREALLAFHSLYHLPHAIISSLSLPKSELEGLHLPAGAEDFLVCAGSSYDFESKKQTAFLIVFPEYKERFEGGWALNRVKSNSRRELFYRGRRRILSPSFGTLQLFCTRPSYLFSS